ncbi:hypothetical protein [Pseudomonas sp. COW5]|uniref:hypothetical protein n=1 Tax=Pseudomonas sp. COW5 TaxID=2981253 RepID=UPI0022451914|nr:hypothetical protein [Pseudomonas sp. COW5]MCX2546182.1 hypothetical protein [Pseudomonas sp. COW5]
MNALAKVAQQTVMVGTCKGTINGSETFDAGLVVLSKATYPLPHGEAHVMQATERGPAPDFKTKELKVSFSVDKPDGSYGLFPDANSVRVVYVDSSDKDKPVAYTQRQGIANVAFDSQQSNFSGDVAITLENLDDDTPKTVNLKFNFEAIPNPPQRRIPRRPASLKGPC